MHCLSNKKKESETKDPRWISYEELQSLVKKSQKNSFLLSFEYYRNTAKYLNYTPTVQEYEESSQRRRVRIIRGKRWQAIILSFLRYLLHPLRRSLHWQTMRLREPRVRVRREEVRHRRYISGVSRLSAEMPATRQGHYRRIFVCTEYHMFHRSSHHLSPHSSNQFPDLRRSFLPSFRHSFMAKAT